MSHVGSLSGGVSDIGWMEIKEMCCWSIKNSAHWTGQGRGIQKSEKLLVELELGLDIELRSSPEFRRLLRLSSV